MIATLPKSEEKSLAVEKSTARYFNECEYRSSDATLLFNHNEYDAHPRRGPSCVIDGT